MLFRSQEQLDADEAFFETTKEACKAKADQWADRSRLRSEELAGINEAIDILTSDEAKATFATADTSFVQISVKQSDSQRTEAYNILKQYAAKSDNVRLAMLASKVYMGTSWHFDSVIADIEKMIEKLREEEQSDIEHRDWCQSERNSANSQNEVLEYDKEQLKAKISRADKASKEMDKERSVTKQEMSALKGEMGNALDLRNEENSDFKTLFASDSAAKEILKFAKNRLNKFYAPKLYKPGLLQESAVYIQVSSHEQKRAPPAPPPESFNAYTKKSEEGAGVTQMIDLLIKELDAELQEAEINEKDAQKDYEGLMAESSTKRADDSKSISDKTASKAAQEEALENEQDNKAATGKELMATLKYIHSLHGECDFLLKYYDARKEARDGETDALGKAKAVLNGADFS